METSQKSATAVAAEMQNAAAAGQKSAEAAAKDATQAVESIKPAEVIPAPTPPAVPNQANLQNVLDQAKNLLAEKKYPEALAALAQLSNVSLSAEQQRLVEQLRAQIQSAMTSEAANEGLKSVGGLLKGNK
jgi:hypothetical protein